jgi:hypothetical protein
MPIGNIVALGFILTFFGTFMVALAWGAWYTNTPPAPRRAPKAARASQPVDYQELAPVRIRR